MFHAACMSLEQPAGTKPKLLEAFCQKKILFFCFLINIDGRLEELRQHEENRRREAMRSRQIAERLGVEEAHMLEFQQFNALWDKRMAEFEQKSADLDEAMKERHGTELMEYIRNAQSEPLR